MYKRIHFLPLFFLVGFVPLACDSLGPLERDNPRDPGSIRADSGKTNSAQATVLNEGVVKIEWYLASQFTIRYEIWRKRDTEQYEFIARTRSVRGPYFDTTSTSGAYTYGIRAVRKDGNYDEVRTKVIQIDKWLQTTNMPRAKTQLIGALNLGENKAFFISHAAERSEIFDLQEKKWYDVAPSFLLQGEPLLLDDGRVFICGISAYIPGIYPSIKIFDPATKIWLSPFRFKEPAEHYGRFQIATLPNGKILMMSWYENNGVEKLFSKIFDPAEMTLSDTDLPEHFRREFALVTLSTGAVLAVGGTANDSTLASSILFTPETGSWSHIPAMSVPRSSPYTVSLDDGRVLVIDGQNQGVPEHSYELFDPNTLSWTSAAATPWSNSATTRIFFVIKLLDGKVLVLVQTDDNYPTYFYDPADDAWMFVENFPKETMPTPGRAVLMPNGHLIVAGLRTKAVLRFRP